MPCTTIFPITFPYKKSSFHSTFHHPKYLGTEKKHGIQTADIDNEVQGSKLKRKMVEEDK